MTVVYGPQYSLGFDVIEDDLWTEEDAKNMIRIALSDMRDTPKRELLHQMIIEISVGVDD